MKHKFCILIATYNEAGNIKTLLDQLKKYDVCIVDDCSPDGTADICRKYPNVTVISRCNKRGVASAYIDGFKYLVDTNKYDYVIQMDAGLTHDPAYIPAMVAAVKERNWGLVLGSRGIDKIKVQSFRTVLSKTARLLTRLIGIKQTDVTCGYRCWSTSTLKCLDFDAVRSKGFAFQWELLYQCNQMNVRIHEIPISYKLTNSSLNRKILMDSIKTISYYIFMRILKWR